MTHFVPFDDPTLLEALAVIKGSYHQPASLSHDQVDATPTLSNRFSAALNAMHSLANEQFTKFRGKFSKHIKRIQLSRGQITSVAITKSSPHRGRPTRSPHHSARKTSGNSSSADGSDPAPAWPTASYRYDTVPSYSSAHKSIFPITCAPQLRNYNYPASHTSVINILRKNTSHSPANNNNQLWLLFWLASTLLKFCVLTPYKKNFKQIDNFFCWLTVFEASHD